VPGVLNERLGSDHLVIEEGLSARTTNVADPTDPRLNGAAYLPSSLASHCRWIWRSSCWAPTTPRCTSTAPRWLM